MRTFAQAVQDSTGIGVTGVVTVAIIVFAVAWEIFAAYTWGRDGTFSVVIASLSLRYPIIPFSVGLLCGHLFAQMDKLP